MTSLSSLPQEPNAPIYLEDISITHINGHRLAEPCSARVVLRLSPTIMPLIESDSFPIGILDDRLKMPFVVTVKDSCDIQVVRFSLRMPGSANGTVKGSLGLYKSPCTVIHPDAKLSSVSFSVLNFPQFYGSRDTWVNSSRLGATELVHKDLRINITEDASLSENENLLRNDGYTVTHTGLIERCASETFSVKEADDILRGLRAFLSFCRGAGCGLTLVKAAYPDGRETILEWGTAHTDPWRSGRDTWMPTIVGGGDNLSQAFSGFWALRSDRHWMDTLFRTIDLYLNCKSGPFHVGIILVQAALESLCHKLVTKKKQDSTGEYLSKAIRHIGLCTAIPPSCSNLAVFFTTRSRVGEDGPIAITELRNDLVHAKRIYENSAEAQMDALRLGQWYIELILLKQFDYHGRYRNRVATAGESPFEKVPWAR